jgi:hypothetical protein
MAAKEAHGVNPVPFLQCIPRTRFGNTCPLEMCMLMGDQDRKPDNRVGFSVIAWRWVVKRFFARINRNRRLAKEFEASIASAEAFLYAASAMLLIRRLVR